MIYIRQILLISGIGTFSVLMLSCGNYKRVKHLKNYRKYEMFTPTDIYAKRITPEQFLLYLKNPNPYVSEYDIYPDSIQIDWVKKSDVIALSKYLDDSTKCVEVVSISSSFTLHTDYRSTVNKEALKLINIYFTKSYLIISKERSYSKDEVLEWLKTNK